MAAKRHEDRVGGALPQQQAFLGSATRAGDPGSRLICIWQSDETCKFLDLVGSPGAINRPGEVAATPQMADGSVHAARWSAAGGQDLGTFRGVDSGANAINDAGIVGGWVSLSASLQDRGQLHYRPAIWRPGSGVDVLMDFGCDWGQVVDLNSAGIALVLGYEGAGIRQTCRAILWDLDSGGHRPVDGDEGRGIFPVALADTGLIVGHARNRQGNAVAFASAAGGSWARLGTPDAWYATAMNDLGYVAGSLPVDGFERPWIRSPAGEITFLPYFAYHTCRPAAITNKGIVAGTAATDHGVHAVLWLPPS